MDHFLQSWTNVAVFENFLHSWTYVAVFGLSLISSMGIPVGAELAIIGGGALASGLVPNGAHGHFHLSIVAVILLATLGEFIGSMFGYLIGMYGGRPLVDRVGKYILLTHKDLDRAEQWFARRGEPLVFFGRFIPLLRSFVSLAAGLGEMAIAKFAVFTVFAVAIWCTVLTVVGYNLGKTYTQVLKNFTNAGYVLAALAVLAVAAVLFHRIRTVRAERQAGTPS
jgi:membrane protein DedA with SNARE-associated domain